MAADHIKRILFKIDYPPCFEPAVLAGLSWFVERREAGIPGSNNIISLPNPSRHLEKDSKKNGLFFSNPLSFFPRAKVNYIRSTL